MGRERAIEAARRARIALGLGDAEPVEDLLETVEARGRLHVAAVPMRPATAGAYVVAPRGRVVLVNTTQWHTRARFTLAHELGHAQLGHGAVLDDVAAVTGRRGHDPQEVEANAYAAEVLAPEAGVCAWWETHREGPPTTEDVVRLAVHFGVSAEVARYRMTETRCLCSRRLAHRIDEEIRASEHRWLIKHFGLEERRDAIRDACDGVPRIPEALRGSVLAQRLGIG